MVKQITFLSGPPKAGKSRLRGDLYTALRASGYRGWFITQLSPDCEGQWVNDCHNLGRGAAAEGMARALKNSLKVSGEFFSPKQVETWCRQLQGLVKSFDLVVADLGGLPSKENEAIVRSVAGTNIIPIVLTNQGDGRWEDFWGKLGLNPVVVEYNERLGEILADAMVSSVVK
ncbi:MAG: hypothetical protein KatS3mg002_1585 [Candidatus Woesearchaeota archaeon]|nr:MAG: hypothetical protein KatS3mg002_1585 [Candidatus Woesearchaeota archaeon]